MCATTSARCGPKSPPLYPAADPNVIAVTATDVDDALFSGANRGSYIVVAAPGVDVLVPAPGATYQFTTGTSVAAAEVSGVAALLIERNPALTPADVRRILMRTAKDLGPRAMTPILAPVSSMRCRPSRWPGRNNRSSCRSAPQRIPRHGSYF